MPRKRPAPRSGPTIKPARLAKLLDLCRSLPDAVSRPAGQGHYAFSVRRKSFAWLLNNHHGDGIVALCCKSTLARQRELVAADPARYLVPAYVGSKGWVSLRLDTPKVNWDDVLDLFVAAYRAQAPRRLAENLR